MRWVGIAEENVLSSSRVDSWFWNNSGITSFLYTRYVKLPQLIIEMPFGIDMLTEFCVCLLEKNYW